MLLVRWSAQTRVLAAETVREDFASHADEALVFAFTTDRMSVGEHAGNFSFKLVTSGAERYWIRGREVLLEPGRLLLTNAGEAYSSAIDRSGTRAISCFVPRADVASALAFLRHPAEALLDGRPALTGDGDVLPVPFRPGRRLERAVSRLQAAVDAAIPPEADRVEELVLDAAALALGDALALVPKDALAGCARPSTREDLLARVLRARDLIEDAHGRVSLDQLADAACLSRYHFLRVFKGAFGVTPARYARGVRLQRGLALLQSGGSSRGAARAAGFTSPSSFRRSLRGGKRAISAPASTRYCSQDTPGGAARPPRTGGGDA